MNNLYKKIKMDQTQYPLSFIEKNGCIVIEKKLNNITIGISEKTSPQIIDRIENYHTEQITFKQIKYVELIAWLSKYYSKTDKNTDITETHHSSETELDKLANDAPTINLVNSICMEAIQKNASDIHIESEKTFARIRFRIDGILTTVQTITSETFLAISSRIKIMANLNILEKRQPQDGRISVSVTHQNIDFRISIVPTIFGESIVMRILGKSSVPLKLDELGFSNHQLKLIHSMLKIQHGLILVTGPTGSGKTTTLNSILNELLNDEIKIISIEDPVEYLVEGINQIQINEQIGLGFDTILRRVLRQDPNIIMVGEIRDKATAELVIRAALTGHLVLSTLHTNDAVSVINRLVNMGIEPYLVSSVLKGTISQRLVRKLSKDGKSYEGRTVISETFVMSETLENMINSLSPNTKILEYLINSGMQTIEDDAKEKVTLGITNSTEVLREIQHI